MRRTQHVTGRRSFRQGCGQPLLATCGPRSPGGLATAAGGPNAPDIICRLVLHLSTMCGLPSRARCSSSTDPSARVSSAVTPAQRGSSSAIPSDITCATTARGCFCLTSGLDRTALRVLGFPPPKAIDPPSSVDAAGRHPGSESPTGFPRSPARSSPARFRGRGMGFPMNASSGGSWSNPDVR